MKHEGFHIAIVGATGAVGKEMIDVLEKRNFPVSHCTMFASARSEGKLVSLQGQKYPCQVLKKGCFDGVKLVFLDASDEVSKEWVPEALRAGAWVVDNSGVHRMNSDVELIVPEVNGELISSEKINQSQKLIAGPNCTTIQLVVSLKPLAEHFGLKRVIVSTYQSVSGAGAAAMDELKQQLSDSLAGKKPEARILKHPIAFNLIPQIGSFDAEGHTSEEKKVVNESRKILGIPDLKITCTAVRVPTLACHAESVNVELGRPFTIDEVREHFKKFPGIVLLDEPSQASYPMNLNAAHTDPVYVGRIRKDHSVENGLQFWIVSDNLRKGAALNAVQIAERIIHSLR